MFVYSLAGLKVDESADLEAVAIEENETTARSSVYQVLGRLFSIPDDDAYDKARDGGWTKELEVASQLLPFNVEIGEETLPDDVSREDFEAEFLRLFEVGGVGGPESPLYGGLYAPDRMAALEEVVRFYEYFGLKTADDDRRPADHLATEADFMQYLTFKEAATQSERLRASYRRAQLDFLERQLSRWVPQLAEKVESQSPMPFYAWATRYLRGFVAADVAYVQGVLGA